MFAWLTAGLLLATAGPASAQALNQDAGWWPWAGAEWERDRDARERVRDRERDNDRDGDRKDRDREARGGNGPAFCRSGQGHPTKGWRWCEEKGWGADRSARDERWRDAGWGDVILRRPTATNRKLEQETLRDILGATVLGRLGTHASGLGARGAIDGRLLNLATGSVLQLRAGGLPLAELTDLDRDGRFDLVLLSGR